MTALTALSRLTGFARVLVVAAVLGTTYLGNTYASANAVPNLVFELFAAGALQAVLVPTLVDLLDAGDRRTAQHVAGSVLGLAAVVLAVPVAAGVLAAPLLMRVLVSGVEAPDVAAAQIRLGTVFLWFFLPQVLLYAAGMVATAVLHASGRFALPAFAPVLNNVVVTAAYGAFWWLRDGAPASLDLTAAQVVVLAGGTTAGVVALSAVPVTAVVRSGFSLRPRLDRRHPVVRRLARRGGWAALSLALTQVLLAAALLLGNRVEGGVVAYQVGFTFFLLPHALFAFPVLTALFPTLARRAVTGAWEGYGAAVERGIAVVAYFGLPATAALAALAPSLSAALLFGQAGGRGATQVAAAVAGFAPGLLGYAVFLLLTRAFYATGDARTPTLVNAGVAAGGVALMVVGFAALDGDARIGGLAAAHSVAYLLGAATLLGVLRRRVPPGARPTPGPAVARAAAAALAAGGAMVLTTAAVGGAGGGSGRSAGLAPLAAALAAGTVTYLVVQQVAGGVTPARVMRLLDATSDGDRPGGRRG